MMTVSFANFFSITNPTNSIYFEVRTPLEFYPSLKNATKKQRENFQLIGLGTGIHWPDIDEDLSVDGIVAALKAYNYKKKSA
jgi:hypothetical protein